MPNRLIEALSRDAAKWAAGGQGGDSGDRAPGAGQEDPRVHENPIVRASARGTRTWTMSTIAIELFAAPWDDPRARGTTRDHQYLQDCDHQDQPTGRRQAAAAKATTHIVQIGIIAALNSGTIPQPTVEAVAQTAHAMSKILLMFRCLAGHNVAVQM